MNVIDTLRKLIAHQKSAEQIGSQDEAAAFAAKISQLLVKHQLELADIVDEETSEASGVDTEHLFPEKYGLPRRRSAWFEQLAAAVARAHFCDVAVWAGSGRSTITVIGRATNREICTFMIVYLSRAARRLCDLELSITLRRNKRTRRAAWRNSFLMAFVQMIRFRYLLLRNEREALQAEALVVLKRAEKEVADYMAPRTQPTKALERAGGHSRSGAALGRFHGSQVNLKANAIAAPGAARSPRLLSE